MEFGLPAIRDLSILEEISRCLAAAYLVEVLAVGTSMTETTKSLGVRIARNRKMEKVLKDAVKKFEAMTPEQKIKMMDKQRESWTRQFRD